MTHTYVCTLIDVHHSSTARSAHQSLSVLRQHPDNCVKAQTYLPGRRSEKYYPKALLTKLAQDLKLQTVPTGKARKIINNCSVLASWRALAAKENDKIREKNKRISEHNEKVQLDDSLTDDMKFKRSKKECPDILGKGGKAFCSKFKYEYGFKKRTSHQGKKERDFDDPLMEENRSEDKSSVTQDQTLPSIDFYKKYVGTSGNTGNKTYEGVWHP